MSKDITLDKRYVEYIAKSTCISIISGLIGACEKNNEDVSIDDIKQEAFRMIADGVKYADEHITNKVSAITEMLKSTMEEQKLKETLLNEKEQMLKEKEERC